MMSLSITASSFVNISGGQQVSVLNLCTSYVHATTFIKTLSSYYTTVTLLKNIVGKPLSTLHYFVNFLFFCCASCTFKFLFGVFLQYLPAVLNRVQTIPCRHRRFLNIRWFYFCTSVRILTNYRHRSDSSFKR